MGEDIRFEPNNNNDNQNIVSQDGDEYFSSVDGEHAENRDGSTIIQVEHLADSAEEKQKDEEEILVPGMEYNCAFLQDMENSDRRENAFLEDSDFLNIGGIAEANEESTPSVSSRACFAVGQNNAHERSAGTNVAIKLDSESEKELSELQNDCGLVNGVDTRTDQETNLDIPTSEFVESSDYGPEKASEESIVGRKTVLLQECKEMVMVSQELSATVNKCLTSVATGLREIGDLQDDNIGQGIGENNSSNKVRVAAMEYKEEAGDGHAGPFVLDEGSIMEIPGYSCKQSCDDNFPSKDCHSEPAIMVEAPHILRLVNENSKAGVRDTVVGVSESCGHDAAIGDPDPISLVHLQNLDAIPQSKEGYQEEEKEGDNLQANDKEEPSADKLPIEQKTNLSAAMQLDEPALTEKLESSDFEPSAPGKSGTIPGTNEHLNLDKEIMSTAAGTHLVSAKEHEAISVGTNEVIDLPKEKAINLKRRSSTSPSSQYTKKHRRRKSSHDGSTTEIIKFGNCALEDKFSVGDLVWGKVRSHPWWPGQIFDPSDASENASNYFQRMNRNDRNDRLLVAFFGDATFGWCDQSQLVPFQPNFAEKVKHATAKAFKNAVMNALDELARRVELGLTCFCEVKEARHVLERKAMLNAGIREGTVVNDHKDIVDAVNTFDSLQFLSTIQRFAKSPRMLCDLEISLACAQASAFLTFKGLLVSGKISLETSGIRGVSIDMRDSAQLRLSPRGHASSSGKHKRTPEEKPSRRTKKRKINELIAYCEPSHEVEEDGNGDNETLLEMAGRIKKRKVMELVAPYVLPDEEGDLNGHDDETLHDIAVTGSGDARRRTPESKEGSVRRRMSTLKTKKDKESESFALDNLSNDTKALQSKKESNSTSSEVDPDAKKTLKTSKLGQCIRKVASELTATPSPTKSKTVRNANSQKNGERVDKSATKGLPSTVKQYPGPIQENSSTRELLSELLIVAKNPLYWAKKKNMPSRLINSFLQFRNAVFEKSSTNSDITKASILNFANESDEPTCPQTSTKLPGSSSISESKAIVLADTELSLRSTSHVRQTVLKRKAEFSLEGAQKKKKRSTKSPSSPLSRKNLKNELEDKTGDRYAKQYSRRAMIPQSSAISLRKFSTDSYDSQGPAILFMEFPKGFALPSEMELKAKFARYGSQEMSEIKVFRRSGCAQIVFKTSATAEDAFNFASENNVFGSENVTFRLRYPSSGSRADKFQKKDRLKQERSIQQDHRQSPAVRDKLRERDGHQETRLQPSNSLARSTEKLGVSRPNTSGEPKLLLIQQNLEMLTSMLSTSEGTSTSASATSDNIPPDSKRDIMDEMMSLLQKVSALVSAPP